MMRPLTALVMTAIALGACDQSGEARSSSRTEVGATKPAPAPAKDPAAPAVLAHGAPPAEPPPPSDDRPDEEDIPLPEEPAPPVAPADYGVIKPSVPPPEPAALTMHALAGYEVVAIHDKPDGESPKLGYLRVGTRTMVGSKQSGPGCPKGWHALAQGGFACANKGLVVDATREPPMPDPPPAARVDQPLPYDYAYVKRWNSPMFWRVPTPEEFTGAEALRTTREQKRLAAEAAAKGLPTPTAKKPAPTEAPKADAPATDDSLKKLPSVDDDTKPDDTKPDDTKPDDTKPDDTKPQPKVAEPKTEPKAQPKADAKADAKAEDKPEEKPVEQPPPSEAEIIAASKLPLKPEKSWLERGFYVSVGEKLTEEGRTWWHTARGGYVDVTHAYKYDAKDFAGIELPAEATFPFGFVMSETTKLIALAPDGKMTTAATLEKRTFVDLDEEIEIGGKTYMTTADGHLIRKSDLRTADPQPLPKGLQPWERWVDVSLDKQILVAYEGEQPVFVSLVSTGKKGTADEPFVTPEGRWRIRSKHISTTMDGNTASDGNYSIQDVPWTMFFEGSYALHGAFWHQGFGRPRSHGCVNLGPSAARWLFNWTTPFLPEGWHGVHAHAGSPGTTVVVRR